MLTMQNTTGKLMGLVVARKLAQDLERRNMPPHPPPPPPPPLNQGIYRAGKTAWENVSRFAYESTKDSRGRKKPWLWRSIWKMHKAECNSNC